MKKELWIGLGLFTLCFQLSYAQEEKTVETIVPQVTNEIRNAEELKKVEKKVDKAQKLADKVEKKNRKLEKYKEKAAKLEKAISVKEKAILKNEKKLVKLEEKRAKGKAKGKLSPADIAKINGKLSKASVSIERDKAKLKKLLKKK